MSTVFRNYPLPPDFSSQQRDDFKRALAAAVRKQKIASEASSRISVAVNVEAADGGMRIEYRRTSDATLAARLGDVQPESQIVRWVHQLCQAFLVAYPVGKPAYLPHGGLTPDCIYCDGDGGLAITDFGVAAAYLGVPGNPDFRIERIPAYIAPEVWRSPDQISQQADILAAGIILYQAATGRHPYDADLNDPDQCRWQMMVESPAKVERWRSDLSAPLAALIFKMVSRDVAERFRTFDEVVKALELFAPPELLHAPPDSGGAAPAPAQEADTATKLISIANEPAVSAEAAEVKRAEAERQAEALRRQQEVERKRREDEQRRRQEELDARRRDEQMQTEKAALEARRIEAEARQRWLRRHRAKLTAGIAAAVVLIGILIGAYVRSANRAVIDGALPNLEQSWRRLVEPGAAVVPASLGFTDEHRNKLDAAAQYLVSAGDVAKPVTVDGHGTGWLYGSAVLRVRFGAGSALEVPLAVDRSARSLGVERGRADAVVEVLSELARNANRGGVAQQIAEQVESFRTKVNRDGPLSELPERLASFGFPNVLATLRWAAFYGYHKVIKVSVHQVPTELGMPVAVTWRIMTTDGPTPLEWSVPGSLTLDSEMPPVVRGMTIDTDEPRTPDHAQWCVDRSTADLRSSFDERDAETFAQALGRPVAAHDVQRMFKWLPPGRESRLVIRPLPAERTPLVTATIEYDVELPGSAERLRGEVGGSVRLDPSVGWRVVEVANLLVPNAPPLVLAREFLELVERQVANALQSGASLTFFGPEGPPGASVDRRIAEMKSGGLSELTIQQTMFDSSSGRLKFRLEPEGSTTWVAQPLEFEPSGDSSEWRYVGTAALPWNKQTPEPELVAAFDQLQLAGWNLDQMQSVVERDGLTPEERQLVKAIVDSVRPLATRSDYQPSPVQSTEWRCGLPQRITLPLSGEYGVDFRLVVVNSGNQPTGAAYVMEREVTVTDYAARGTGLPERLAAAEAVVRELGLPPRPSQPSSAVVAVTYDEAASFATSLGCQLPIADEWRALRGQAGSDAESFDPGQVLEWCRLRDDGSASTAEVVGTSWIHNDPDFNAYYRQRLAADTGVQLHPKDRPDPTIGFRLAIPLNLPRDALERLRDAE